MGGRQAHLVPRRWVFLPLKSPALLAVLAATWIGLPINFSVRVSTPSDSFIYLGLQMRNCGSQLFCPHFIRERFAARAEGCILRKDEVASRKERPRVQRPAPLLIAESAGRRSAPIEFSRQKDAWALLPLPFPVKTKALPELLS